MLDLPPDTNSPTPTEPTMLMPTGPGTYPPETPSALTWDSPPAGVMYPAPAPARRTRWLYPVGVLAVIALLAAAFAIGHAASGSGTSTPTTGTVGGVAPTVVVPPSAQDLQQTVINVIHTVQPSVVEVTGQTPFGEVIGSGDIVTSDGYIVTNDHVVADGGTFTVTLSNGQIYPATVAGTDPQDDLAVLKIAATRLQSISFADSSKVQVGEFAIAIGSPLGLEQSATLGIVSAVNRTESEGSGGTTPTLTGLIQTSAPINPGNSGGALVNLQGQLIGIPTLGASSSQNGGTADGIGFAIASDRVKFVAQQLIQSGHLVSSGQGFMGIQGQDVTPQLASAYNLPVQSGVLIAAFVNDAAGSSPAQAAGLRTGDIIVAVNGHAVADSSDLASALTTQSPGTKVSITVQRRSSQLTATVTLGERPASG